MRYAYWQFTKLLLWSFCVSAFSSGARAETQWEEVRLHGFATQSLVYTTHNQMAGNGLDGRRVGTQMRDLGGNISWKVSPAVLLSTQLISRWTGALTDGKTEVDYAFVDTALVNEAGTNIGVQFGKVKNPFGFYNATRDVAHTRNSILLPQSIYHEQLRNFFLSAPGISLHGSNELETDTLLWQVSWLKPNTRSSELTAFMVDAQGGHFVGQASLLARALYEVDGGRWRWGLSVGALGMKFNPLPTDFFGAGAFSGQGQIVLNTGVLSVEHNRADWSHTAEFALTRQHRNGFNVPFAPTLDQSTTIGAYYLQSAWRFAENWQALVRYDAIYLDLQDRHGAVFAQVTGLPAAQRYASDWTIGGRFDPAKNWSLFAELHHVQGGAWLAKTDNPPNRLTDTWDMLLLRAAVHF